MSVAKASKTNGKVRRASAHSRSIAEHGRQIRHDARALTTAVQHVTDGVDRYLVEQVHRRPYRTVGVAAGVGYIFGGGISLRLATTLLSAATRVAMALAAQELAERFLASGDTASAKRS